MRNTCVFLLVCLLKFCLLNMVCIVYAVMVCDDLYVSFKLYWRLQCAYSEYSVE